MTSSNKDQVITDVGKSNLTDDDKRTYAAATMRSAIGNYSLDGKNVAQIIDEQRKWQSERDAEAETAREAQAKIQSQRAALVEQMNRSVSVQPLSKSFKPADIDNDQFDSYQLVSFQFHNTGTKAISGVKGGIKFTNSFGDKVINLSLEEGTATKGSVILPPGRMLTDQIQWKYNEYDDEWKTFRATELTSMKAEWIPMEIIFSDGSSLKAPDPE